MLRYYTEKFKEDVKRFNKDEVQIAEASNGDVEIKSSKSLFRLSVFIEGWLARHNADYDMYAMCIKMRSKYCVVVGLVSK